MDHHYHRWCHEQMIHERHLRGFIDDVRISVRAKGEEAVATMLSHIGGVVGTALKGIRCKISPKTTILGTTNKIVNTTKSYLLAEGIPAKIGTIGKDLGIATNLAQKRVVALNKSRFSRAHERAKLIGRLTESNRTAKALYTTGAWPQANYGLEAIGCTPTYRAYLRAGASKAVAPGCTGGCPLCAGPV